jgi:hypothetical protein
LSFFVKAVTVMAVMAAVVVAAAVMAPVVEAAVAVFSDYNTYQTRVILSCFGLGCGS